MAMKHCPACRSSRDMEQPFPLIDTDDADWGEWICRDCDTAILSGLADSGWTEDVA